MFTNVGVRTLVYDHTFAFPRMIWYLALVCLLLMNYSFKQIGISTLVLYGMYVVIGIFYYLSTVGFLKNSKTSGVIMPNNGMCCPLCLCLIFLCSLSVLPEWSIVSRRTAHGKQKTLPRRSRYLKDPYQRLAGCHGSDP